MDQTHESVQKKETDKMETDFQQQNVADSQEKLNQRREARRRKILDNAKNRMEKLGVRSNNFTAQDEMHNGFFEYSDPEVEPNEIRFPFNNLMGSSASTSQSQQYDPFADEKPYKDPVVFKYRLHVLVSIVLAYILAIFGFMGIGNYGIAIPTCIFMALEVVLRKPKPVNPIAALVVAVLKLPTREANIIWRLTTILYDLVVNLGLTIFCIVSLTLLRDYIQGSNLLLLQ